MTAFADLTADQQRALLLCVSRTVSVTAEVLDADLNVTSDISSRLVQSGSTVQWDAASVVHRGCTVQLALADGEFDWSQDLLRLSMTITDDVTGLSATAPVGVFSLTQPDKTTGAVVTDQNSPALGRVAYSVTGKDVTTILDRLIGFSHVAPAKDGDDNPIGVLDTALALAELASFPADTVQVDTTAASTPMAKTMTWPWIAVQGSDSTVDSSTGPTQPADAVSDATSGPSSYRGAINDVIGQINYRAVWADGGGLLRFTPYVDPVSAPSTFVFDAAQKIPLYNKGPLTPMVSPLEPARTRSQNVAGFNDFTFIWSNAPTNDVPPGLPGYVDPGITVVHLTNDTDGPASIQARGGGPRAVSATQVQISAADTDTFQAQAQNQFAAAKRAVTTYSVRTIPFPMAGHYDVFVYRDEDTVPGGEAKVQAVSWTLQLDGSGTDWKWQAVS